MSKKRTAYALRTFNDGPDLNSPARRRGDKLSLDEDRYNDLKENGLISDEKPGPRARPRAAAVRSGRRMQARLSPAERRQDRDGDEELDPAEALEVLKRHGLAPESATIEELREQAEKHRAWLAGEGPPPEEEKPPAEAPAAGQEKPGAADDDDAAAAENEPPAGENRPKRGNRPAS